MCQIFRLLSSIYSLLAGGWALNRKDLKLIQSIGKGEFGGKDYCNNVVVVFFLSTHVKIIVCSVLRCNGWRLQRDQGGCQVYQKWCHSTGLYCRSLCHDVNHCTVLVFRPKIHQCIRYGEVSSWWHKCFCCVSQAVETQQPGAVVRCNSRGEGQSLYCYRVHGQGQSDVCFFLLFGLESFQTSLL